MFFWNWQYAVPSVCLLYVFHNWQYRMLACPVSAIGLYFCSVLFLPILSHVSIRHGISSVACWYASQNWDNTMLKRLFGCLSAPFFSKKFGFVHCIPESGMVISIVFLLVCVLDMQCLMLALPKYPCCLHILFLLMINNFYHSLSYPGGLEFMACISSVSCLCLTALATLYLVL